VYNFYFFDESEAVLSKPRRLFLASRIPEWITGCAMRFDAYLGMYRLQHTSHLLSHTLIQSNSLNRIDHTKRSCITGSVTFAQVSTSFRIPRVSDTPQGSTCPSPADLELRMEAYECPRLNTISCSLLLPLPALMALQ